MPRISYNLENIDKVITVLVLTLLLAFTVVQIPDIGVSAPSDEGAELPTWKKNDQWNYRLKLGPSKSTDINQTVTEVGSEISIDQETYRCYQVTTESNNTVETYYHIDTLSKVLSRRNSENVTYFKPPLPRLKFPLKVNKSWNGTTYTFDQTQNADPVERVNYSYNIVKKTDLEVDAGTFSAYKINLTMVSYKYESEYPSGTKYAATQTIYYYSPEVKNYLKVESYEIRDYRRPVGTQILHSYDLAPRGNDDKDGENTTAPGSIALGITIVGTTAVYTYVRTGSKRATVKEDKKKEKGKN